uniref:Uncharacterized protein n=1 Tax=viral metagenome TaxID=1070528 RepID=A0A6H1ZEZ0_9ZZZZ
MFCKEYKTKKEARKACQCDCSEAQEATTTYYECNYGDCCGYHCSICGKFEVVS